MAAISRSRRSAAGFAFIIGGALLLLNLVLGLAKVAGLGSWLVLLAYLAFAVGFIVLAVGSVANLVARIALIVAGVGWALLALGLLTSLPEGVGTVAAVLAAVGGIVGAIVLYTGKEITDRSAIAFIATTIVAAFFLLVPAIAGLETLIVLLVGLGFVVTGVLFHWVQRGRR